MNNSILVIDDCELILDMVSLILESAGYRVTAQSDPEQAISLCSTKPFDLVLCDLCFDSLNSKNGMTSGFDAIMEIKRKFPEKHVVVMSGLVREQELLAMSKIGVNGCISKPFQMDELLAVVGSALSGVVAIKNVA